ncbi:hypothetical protein BDV23DRAFT_143500 [Aspergillus alliaceus]|uniref:Uncharacterized protein n=1 Tax=Petromyces alliaceus TaxID=209559 RepID=A0A5N7CRA2_PETAA|nr:hypothetical protein BDV23DRAFT_143500 [Aspergillus alliaceus]
MVAFSIWCFLLSSSPLGTPAQRHRPCAQDPSLIGVSPIKDPEFVFNAILLLVEGRLPVHLRKFPRSPSMDYLQAVRLSAQLHDDALASRWRVNSQTECHTVEGDSKAKWGGKEESNEICHSSLSMGRLSVDPVFGRLCSERESGT